MKKAYLSLTAVLLTVIGLSAQTLPPGPGGPAAAVSTAARRPSVLFFARFGSFSPTDGFFKSIYGSGLIAGLEGRVRLIDHLYVSVEGGFFRKSGALTVTGEKTTLTIVPLDLMAVYHFHPSGILSPYLGAGGSLCLYTEKNVLGAGDGSGFGPAFCGGITIRRRSVGVDARLKYSSVKIKPFDVEAGLGGLSLSFAAVLSF